MKFIELYTYVRICICRYTIVSSWVLRWRIWLTRILIKKYQVEYENKHCLIMSLKSSLDDVLLFLLLFFFCDLTYSDTRVILRAKIES